MERPIDNAATPGPRIQILLALCDGAPYVDAQLASFAAQTHSEWSLLVSDDASRDDGPGRVRRFAAQCPRHRVELLAGPRAGYGQNFLSLLSRADPGAGLIALSDQDDVWLPHHLSRASGRLAALQTEIPALYCARSMICDADLVPKRVSTLFPRPPAFANALVQSLAGGHTMVLNRAAADLAARWAPRMQGRIAHDWWLYQLVTGAGGRVIYDAEPALLYRQHGGNQIGDTLTLHETLRRVRTLLAGSFRDWNDLNLARLGVLAPALTPEARRLATGFAAARAARPGWRRARMIHRAGLYRQTGPAQAALYLAALLGRV